MKRTILISTGVATALLLTACGGGDDGTSSAADTSGAPQPINSVADVASQLDSAMKSGDCRAFSQLYQDPSSSQCERGLISSTRVSGSAEYETGGVIDATDPNEMVTFDLAVDDSGRFVITQSQLETEASVDSPASSKDRADSDAAANDVIDALREKDCDKFFANAQTVGVKAETCATAFSNQNPTIDLLANDPSMEPEYLGGNADVAFYSLSFNGGETYMTMPVVYNSQGARYLGLIPVSAT
jgi:hypothetical protein